MNELDRALQLYRAEYPEKPRGKETITDLLFFLVHRVDHLQEQLKARKPKQPRKTAKQSEQSIERAFSWFGMKVPGKETISKNNEDIAKG